MEVETNENEMNILQFSDCIMIYLMTFLDATSLYQLSRTCTYFETLVTESKLWRRIDAREEPNSTDKVVYCIQRINDRTSSLFFKATDKVTGNIPYSFFSTIKAMENITVMALENQHFNAKKITLNEFPPCLNELSLKRTYVKNSRLFFRYSHENTNHLKVIILDECKWLESSAFLSLAKYKNLEIISVIKCPSLSNNAMPYLSMARRGCPKLKLVDCRFTVLGHTLLTIFYDLPTLLSLYFQTLDTHYKDYKDNTIFDNGTVTKKKISYDGFDETITDTSLIDYCTSDGIISNNLPESMLYKDPYGECTCDGRQKDDDTDQLPEEDVTPVYPDLHYYKKRTLRFRNVLRMANMYVQGYDDGDFQEDEESEEEPNKDSSSDEDNSPFKFDEQNMVVIQFITRPEINSNSNNSTDNHNATASNNSPSQDPDNSRTPRRNYKRKIIDLNSGEDSNKRVKLITVSARNHDEQPPSANAGPSTSRENSENNQILVNNLKSRLRRDVRTIKIGRLHKRENKKVPLRRLSLRGFKKVTNLGLNYLNNLNLELLDLTYTSVTPDGIENFLIDNPNCRIIHPKYCICKPTKPM